MSWFVHLMWDSRHNPLGAKLDVIYGIGEHRGDAHIGRLQRVVALCEFRIEEPTRDLGRPHIGANASFILGTLAGVHGGAGPVS